MLQAIEVWVQRLGVVAGAATLALAVRQAARGDPGRGGSVSTPAARRLLRPPVQLGIGALWATACILLWRPIPFVPRPAARATLLIVGSALYVGGTALYLWGATTLGAMWRTSSAFGALLSRDQRLVIGGPYALVRHPMYLGLQTGALGGLLLYRTWTLVFVFVNFMALCARARREEEALAAEFGEQWEEYCQRVPRWLPRLRR